MHAGSRPSIFTAVRRKRATTQPVKKLSTSWIGQYETIASDGVNATIRKGRGTQGDPIS